MEQEWSEYIGISAFKSSHTIKSYKNNHTRLTDYLQMPIRQAKPDEIIAAIQNLSTNPNSRRTIVNTAIVFYNMVDKDIKKLNKYRTKLDEDIVIFKNQKDAEKGETLPTIDELNKYLKSLYTRNMWSEFILNYLLMTFNTRNIDLDVEVVNSIHATKKDKTRNYLVVRKNDIVYIRYKYKTIKTYGVKRNIFKSTLVERAIRRLREERGKDKPLFIMANKDGSRIAESSNSNFVKNRTLNNITEGDINKIYVTDYADNGNVDGLIRISNNRGTDLETLFTSYKIPQSLFPSA